MKYLSRNKIYEKLEASKTAKKVYIFCEGEVTEIQYFKYFKGFSSNVDIIPIANNNSQSDPLKLKDHATTLFIGENENPPKYKLSKEYKDEVWFVIDTDRWNEGDKIQQLKDFCIENNAHNVHWYTAQSNPCFEIWLYYHFHSTKPDQADIRKFTTFKEFIGSVIRGGFDNRCMPIEICAAVENSKKNFEIEKEKEQPKLYSTEVHFLGDVLLQFVEEQIKKCKERT